VPTDEYLIVMWYYYHARKLQNVHLRPISSLAILFLIL
jgi:hypothetical protein